MGNTYVELKTDLEEKRIIAFGCGHFFKKFLLRYPLLSEKIAYIIDNNATCNNYSYDDICIPVYRPSNLKKEDLQRHIIIFFASKWKEMKRQLDELLDINYQYYYFPFEVDYMHDKEITYYHRVVIPVVEELEKNNGLQYILNLFHLDSKKQLITKMVEKGIVSIPRIPIVLTPKCSLKCKECNNLMWKFETYQDLSTEKIKKSIKRLIDSVDFLPTVELIGGEPFAAKNIKEVLDFIIEEKKVLHIEITTNATIIPQQELIKSLQNEKVNVRISDYSMIVNQNRFIECIQENKINYKKLSFERWIATGGIEKRNRKSMDLIKQYYRCDAGYLCKTLWEDKIYPCARAASLAKLGICGECPYVDVLHSENLSEQLIHFFMAPTCGPCDYCNVALEEVEVVEPAIQLMGRINR